jgi:malonate-semialdehyde dehydrogenase (acetylating)/methylmalonate-semialdehyde dehydrogenase
VVEFACGIPHLLKGDFTENVSTGVDGTRSASRWAWWPASRRSTSPHGADVDVPGRDRLRQHLRAQAVRARSLGLAVASPSCSSRPACPTACSTWCTATRCGGRAARASRRQGISFVGSTPIAKYIYETGAHHGKRVQALGGAKNHMVVMPDADMDQDRRRADGCGLRLGRRALHGDLGGRAVVGDETADALRRKLAPRVHALKIGPGDATGMPTWGR